MQTDELFLGDLIEGKGIEVCQRIGNGQGETNLLLDESGTERAGNRLTAGKKGEIAALSAIADQILLQNVQTDIAVLLLKAAHQARNKGGGGVHGEGHIHHTIFPRVVDLPMDRLQLLEDPVGMIEHNDSVFVELDAFPFAVKELYLQFVLQHADGTA